MIMDVTSFLGNVVEVECGESAIYIGKVDGIDTKLQQISLIESRPWFFEAVDKNFYFCKAKFKVTFYNPNTINIHINEEGFMCENI